MNRLISHRHYSSSTCSNCNFTCFLLSISPFFSLLWCAHSYRQKLGGITRSPYLSLPLPCPQFTTTRSPEKTHHQLLRGVLRCVLAHRYGERELCRGANEKRPCAACHLRSACSAPVQLTGCGPSCSPPRKSN